jgi:hypothetical protein
MSGLHLPAAVTPVAHRLYADFLMPSRLGAYRAFLELAIAQGYDIRPVGDFALAAPETAGPRTLILRHDIDTDAGTAGRMWAVDRDLGIRTSYFFRLSTLDLVLIQRIADGGAEVSYHYEELTTVMKHRRPRTRAEAEQCIPEARDLFAANLTRLRRQTGLPMRVVASHGDFVNRRLDIPNWAILADDGFRRELGIDLEAYDGSFLDRLTEEQRYSDMPYPRYWKAMDPSIALRAGDPLVYALVHPRHWRTAPLLNARDDLQRLVEGARFGRGSGRG